MAITRTGRLRGGYVGALLLLLTGSLAQAQNKSPEQRAAEAIERALQKHGPEVHRCFETALADRLDVAGELELEVDVGAGGKVTAARLLPPKTGSAPPALARCVEDSARHFVIAGIEPGASVVLPFSFQGQAEQFAVKAADAPDHGPRPPGTKTSTGLPRPAPFAVKILIDPVNTRAPKAALTLLTVSPKNRVAMHRHPNSAKALYLLSGRARLLGASGFTPLALNPGAAVFVPAGYPIALETTAAKDAAVFLQIFVPPGPERVYRDPTDAEARASFEVVRDPTRATAPAGVAPVLVDAATAPAHNVGSPGGGPKFSARILLDEKATGSPALGLSVVDFPPGFEVPRHAHEGSSEVLFIEEGAGTLEVGSEKVPYEAKTALYLPAGQPHAAKMSPAGPTRAIQIYAPAGPEQRFRGGPAAAAK
jgi:quercetin dioxygenase-like cupin family protein